MPPVRPSTTPTAMLSRPRNTGASAVASCWFSQAEGAGRRPVTVAGEADPGEVPATAGVCWGAAFGLAECCGGLAGTTSTIKRAALDRGTHAMPNPAPRGTPPPRARGGAAGAAGVNPPSPFDATASINQAAERRHRKGHFRGFAVVGTVRPVDVPIGGLGQPWHARRYIHREPGHWSVQRNLEARDRLAEPPPPGPPG